MATWSALLFSAALLVGGCSKSKAGEGSAGSAAGSGAANAAAAPAPGGQKDGATGLEAFVLSIREACAAKDFAKGKALVLGAIPSKEDMKKVLAETAPLEGMEKLEEFYRQMPPADEQVACLFSPDPARTVVTVYTATVEQILAYEDGTDAYKEFPEGARDVVDTLRPGTTFYEVEVTAPGQDAGTKFHMFFWDGKRWKMLGPLWRAFK